MKIYLTRARRTRIFQVTADNCFGRIRLAGLLGNLKTFRQTETFGKPKDSDSHKA